MLLIFLQFNHEVIKNNLCVLILIITMLCDVIMIEVRIFGFLRSLSGGSLCCAGRLKMIWRLLMICSRGMMVFTIVVRGLILGQRKGLSCFLCILFFINTGQLICHLPCYFHIPSKYNPGQHHQQTPRNLHKSSTPSQQDQHNQLTPQIWEHS